MKIALASYPRSGQTWLRYMMREAVGADAIDALIDPIHADDTYDRYEKAVHLIRSPFDCIASFVEYNESNRELEAFAQGWRRHTLAWGRKYSGQLLTVVYERLVTSTRTEMNRVVEFLGVGGNVDRAIEKASTLELMRQFPHEHPRVYCKFGSMRMGVLTLSDNDVDTIRRVTRDAWDVLLQSR